MNKNDDYFKIVINQNYTEGTLESKYYSFIRDEEIKYVVKEIKMLIDHFYDNLYDSLSLIVDNELKLTN